MKYNNSTSGISVKSSTASSNYAMSPILAEILHEYADETISDEQVQRVLAPVLKMIRDGKFSRCPTYCGRPQ